MHSPDLIRQFIELRAQGRSILDIAEKLGVPRSTLGDWQHRYSDEIQLASAANWEYCEASGDLGFVKDLTRLAIRLHRCHDELDRRSLSRMSNSELIRLTFATRREYFKRRDPIMKPLERRPPCLTPDPNPNLNLNPTPSSNGHPKPEKTGTKPEIQPNHRNGNNLHESVSPVVTPEVTRGHFSRQPPASTDPEPADAVHDSATPNNSHAPHDGHPPDNGRATCPHGAAAASVPAVSISAPPRLSGSTSLSEASQPKAETPKPEHPISPLDHPNKKRSHNGIYLGNTAFPAMAINSINAQTKHGS